MPNGSTINLAESGRGRRRTCFLVEKDTSLKGIAMIPARGLNVGPTIANFIKARIINKREQLPWRDRTNPLSRDD